MTSDDALNPAPAKLVVVFLISFVKQRHWALWINDTSDNKKQETRWANAMKVQRGLVA